MAISTSALFDCVASLVPDVTNKDLRNKLYCMQLSGWITSELYSNKEYFYTCNDLDVFGYSFKDGVSDRDSARRKADVAAALLNAERPPKHVRLHDARIDRELERRVRPRTPGLDAHHRDGPTQI
jgi:hypothetical protein